MDTGSSTQPTFGDLVLTAEVPQLCEFCEPASAGRRTADQGFAQNLSKFPSSAR